MVFSTLSIPKPSELVFGFSPKPVRCGFDLEIGAGTVFPEVNFTLPAIGISGESWQAVVNHYEEIASHILKRLVALKVPGVVLEFELLPAMTETPEWGAELTALLRRHLKDAHEKHGLKCALRVTPTDIRDQGKLPALRSGAAWDRLKRSFELCIEAGADIVSIESVGGKEVHDPGLMYGDVRSIAFALGVLAPRDMSWLWSEIVGMCKAGGRAAPGGDTACGFANTAMRLAHQKMLPETLAAVVRAMSAVRSLVAFEQGAVGPSKDCAYEGPLSKPLRAVPFRWRARRRRARISARWATLRRRCAICGATRACRTSGCCLAMPEAFAEILAYDCRLMNVAAASGGALTLRQWLVDSDEWLSPQAAVLSPAAVIEVAEAIVGADSHYHATIAAGRAGVSILRRGVASGSLNVGRKELVWLDRIETELVSLPEAEAELLQEMRQLHADRFDPLSYGLNSDSEGIRARINRKK